MAKAVLISIQPKWCELIASGKKTIEVRKTKPKLKTPFKVYIYCTKDEPLYHSGEKFWCGEEWGNGKVIGEFVCDRIIDIPYDEYFAEYYHYMPQEELKATCLDMGHIDEYLLSENGYGWHISDLVIYDKPRKFSEFYKPCVFGEDDVSCFLCEKSGYTPDMHIDCFNKVTRPPQSWCYVEEVHNGTENTDSL